MISAHVTKFFLATHSLSNSIKVLFYILWKRPLKFLLFDLFHQRKSDARVW